MEIFKRTIKTLSEQDLKNKIVRENNFDLNGFGDVVNSQKDKYNQKVIEQKTFNIQFFLTQNVKDLGIYNDVEKNDR